MRLRHACAWRKERPPPGNTILASLSLNEESAAAQKCSNLCGNAFDHGQTGRKKRSTVRMRPRRMSRRPSRSLRDRASAHQLELKAIAGLRLGRCLKPRGLACISFRKPIDFTERKSFGVVSGHLALLDAHAMITRHKTVSGLKRLEHKPSLSGSTTNCRKVVLQRVERHERIFDGRSVERHNSQRRKRRRPAFHPLIGRPRTSDARNRNGSAKKKSGIEAGQACSITPDCLSRSGLV